MPPHRIASASTPSRSIFFSSAKCGSSIFTSVATATVMKMPGMTFTRNSQCQETISVIHPPSAGPTVGASVTSRPMITITLPCRCRPNRIMAAEKTVGIIAPPRKPWMARATIMPPIVSTMAHSSEARVKPADDSTNSQRMERARDRNPHSGIITTSATR